MTTPSWQAFLEPTAWALLHFLWQGTLVVLAAAVALRLERRASAQVRYLTACSALALMAVLPIATAFYLSGGPSPAAEAVPVVLPAAVDALSSPAVASPVERATPRAASPLSIPPQVREHLAPFLPILLGVWMVGVALLTAGHLGGWRRVRALSRDTRPVPERWEAALGRLASRLGVSRPVRLYESARVGVPIVFGWLKPAILVPASAFAGLSPAQLEAVLAHELAHVRRHDYLVNLFQIVAETLLFYHPAVWWISGRARLERENCCDDLAVAVSGNPVAYARALADLEELRFAVPALALGADGGSLLGRVRRLLGKGEVPANSWTSLAAGSLAAAVLAVSGLSLLLVASTTTAAPADPQEESDPPVVEETVEPEREEPKGIDHEEPNIDWEEPVDVDWEEPTDVDWEESDWEEPERQIAWAEDEDEDREGFRFRWRWHREATAEELQEAAAGTSYEGLTEDDFRRLARYGAEEDLFEALDAADIMGAAMAELKDLVKHGVDGGDIEDYRASGYELDIDSMVELARYGVDGEDVRDFHRAGYTGLAVEELVDLAKYGVDGEDVHEYTRAGYTDLAVGDLIDLAKHGVDGEDVQDYVASGYTDLAVGDLIDLAKYGVDGDDVQDYAASGYTDLAVGDLIDLAKHGVDGDDMQDYAASGYTDLAVGDLIDLAKHGVDGDDVQDYAAAGYTELTVDDLIGLAKHGVDGEDVADYVKAGWTELTVEDLIDLAKHGVDGEDVEDYAAAGHIELSADDLIRLAKYGVDGEDVADLAAAGYPDLSVDDLVDLAKHGVDGDDAAEIAEAGYPNLTVDELVALARYGIDGDDLQELREEGRNLSIDEVIRLARRGRLDQDDDWDDDD